MKIKPDTSEYYYVKVKEGSSRCRGSLLFVISVVGQGLVHLLSLADKTEPFRNFILWVDNVEIALDIRRFAVNIIL